MLVDCDGIVGVPLNALRHRARRACRVARKYRPVLAAVGAGSRTIRRHGPMPRREEAAAADPRARHLFAEAATDVSTRREA